MEVEALGRVEETNQYIEYITHFAKAVELYQKRKTITALGVGAPIISYETAQGTLADPPRKCS